MTPRPEGPEPYRLSRARINEIDRATPDWETLEAECDFGPRAHVRVLLEHIAYVEAERDRFLRLARRGAVQADEADSDG